VQSCDSNESSPFMHAYHAFFWIKYALPWLTRNDSHLHVFLFLFPVNMTVFQFGRRWKWRIPLVTRASFIKL